MPLHPHHEHGLPPLLDDLVFRRQKLHKIRIGGTTRRGLTVSLCGVMVQPVGNPVQAGGLYQQCQRCNSLASLHPVNPTWWDAMTQRVSALLLDDIRSTTLAVGQAIANERDHHHTLQRVDNDLRHLCHAIGLPQPPVPSLHHRSTRS